MLQQFIEFVGNHWILSSLWVALLLGFLLHRSRTGAPAIGPQQAVMTINREDAVVLDIREKKEFDEGHVTGAYHIPMASLGKRISELERYKQTPVIVVCKMGQQSGEAAKMLQDAGFERVMRLRGGMAEWKADNLPVVQK